MDIKNKTNGTKLQKNLIKQFYWNQKRKVIFWIALTYLWFYCHWFRYLPQRESELKCYLLKRELLLNLRRNHNINISLPNHRFLTFKTIFAVMQAGFAFLECGAVRSKNTTNILIKNMLDACKYYANANDTISFIVVSVVVIRSDINICMTHCIIHLYYYIT